MTVLLTTCWIALLFRFISFQLVRQPSHGYVGYRDVTNNQQQPSTPAKKKKTTLLVPNRLVSFYTPTCRSRLGG